MAGTATYNPATRIIDVSADGLPNPVLYGTFPNANNPSSVTEQDFDHDFYFRGGTFGVTRTFDDATYTQNGYLVSLPLSANDNTLLGTTASGQIRVGDSILFVFDWHCNSSMQVVFTSGRLVLY